MTKKLTFPENFLWGAATASYQVEGTIRNTDWYRGGQKGIVPLVSDGIDHFHLYEKDFDIAKELGHNAHRFSIEWARIEPKEGVFDPEAIEHYRNVLQSLHNRGIEPFVTLWHFTLPLWFVDRGGWEREDAPEIFARYCEYVVKELGSLATHWATINEPMVVSSIGYVRGAWPPFQKHNFFAFLRVVKQLSKGHKFAYRRIKKSNQNAQVMIVRQNLYYFSRNPIAMPIAVGIRWFWNHRFFSLINNEFDTIGLNYYRPHEFHKMTKRPKNDMGWDIYPKGLYFVLKELKRYNKPIYITENGIADRKDTKRLQYIKDHLRWAHQAIAEGVDLRGYLHWSLLDNFEWAEGYKEKFGLVGIDHDTKERTVKRSALGYKKIAESNTLEI